MKKNLLSIGLPLVVVSLVAFMVAHAATPKNPHKKLKFDCEKCHSAASFTDIRFDHNLTGYQLDDNHSQADCLGCHSVEDFSRAKADCAVCHEDIHESRMGSDCEKCHSSTRGWNIMDVQTIHMESNFPAMGRHALIDCQNCHPGLPKEDLSFNTTRCVECHQQDFLNVSSPNHVSGGFSTECQDCHQMNTWRPAGLVEHEPFFPIYSGAHRGQWDQCATCHVNPDNNADFSCFNCHGHPQTDTDNDHRGISGYVYNSQDCYLCHPTGESGSFGDHDAQFFPIFTGSHANTWSDCVECHSDPNDRKVFDCLTCHPNPKSDNIHQGISGYSFDSPSCLSCHPDGKKGNFANHDAEFFPIFSGTHANQWNDCIECHDNPNDRKVFDCLTCHPNPGTDNTHQGMPGYSFNSSNCYGCHPDGKKGKFTDHDATFFPIFSGKHRGKWDACADCHTKPQQRSFFTCLEGCHKHSLSKMNKKHKGRNGYSPDGPSCINCHPDGRE